MNKVQLKSKISELEEDLKNYKELLENDFNLTTDEYVYPYINKELATRFLEIKSNLFQKEGRNLEREICNTDCEIPIFKYQRGDKLIYKEDGKEWTITDKRYVIDILLDEHLNNNFPPDVSLCYWITNSGKWHSKIVHESELSEPSVFIEDKDQVL